ncbi:hypothetical protein N7475_004073 [Penicillium sp. IBT 31633x]|nr:hypothetical protein N7475_004073 [Penicillium sp. IBT 31633x]
MFNFNFFKSTPANETATETTWNANTVTMQPISPAAPSSNRNAISEQPASQEQMQLRGGGGGGFCCGMYVFPSQVEPISGDVSSCEQSPQSKKTNFFPVVPVSLVSSAVIVAAR